MERIFAFFAPANAWDAIIKFLVFEVLIGPLNVLFHHGVLGVPIATVHLTVATGFFVSAPFIALALAMLAHLRRLRTQLAELATTDMLTGLPNRRAFIDSIAQDARLRAAGTFLMIDLDHFKRINDTHGHQIGDLCLKAAADLIRQQANGSVCARLGGEEFAVFVTEAPRDVNQIANTLAAGLTVDAPTIGAVPMTMSVGLHAAPEGSALVQVMSHADQALYLAKANGRARAEVWTPPGLSEPAA